MKEGGKKERKEGRDQVMEERSVKRGEGKRQRDERVDR